MSGYESPTPEEEAPAPAEQSPEESTAPAPEDMLADGSAESRSASREEPPRDTDETTGLVSPGTTADGAGTTT